MLEVTEAIRQLPALAGPLPEFDPTAAPADPDELFADWLTSAIAAGVREPHAMTLSTVDSTGRPDARVLILKDLTAGAWRFASGADSAKGRQLATTPHAALTFYWPTLGRQVRVRGPVSPASAAAGAEDFLARSRAARAIAMLGRQSTPLAGERARDEAIAAAAARLDAEPDLICPEWTRYELAATEIEFWQGATDRKHVRLHYTKENDRWTPRQLWP
jgi:pyridoxamine 5'-phosphate oxidase